VDQVEERDINAHPLKSDNMSKEAIEMPYSMRKDDWGYTVRSPHGTKAKRTTKRKAERQIRLLNAIEHGFKPRKRRGHHSCENGEYLDSRINKFSVMKN
jgi:hypothetical protein